MSFNDFVFVRKDQKSVYYVIRAIKIKNENDSFDLL